MWKNQHIVPHNWKWWVKWEGNTKFTKVFDTQKEAIDYWRKIARNQKSELFIHRQNWQIRDRDSYWNDNFPPRG